MLLSILGEIITTAFYQTAGACMGCSCYHRHFLPLPSQQKFGVIRKHKRTGLIYSVVRMLEPMCWFIMIVHTILVKLVGQWQCHERRLSWMSQTPSSLPLIFRVGEKPTKYSNKVQHIQEYGFTDVHCPQMWTLTPFLSSWAAVKKKKKSRLQIWAFTINSAIHMPFGLYRQD